MTKVLVTCPPMLGLMDVCRLRFVDAGIEVCCPDVVQTLSEERLIQLVPDFDGWIIGDDPATRSVLTAGRRGRLRAAVKWGIGIDNVDFTACEDLGIQVTNTPGMFGREVADLAMSYIVGLARETLVVHEGVRSGNWPKPRGISLAERTLGLIGFGDIGANLARRALAADMRVLVYDPLFRPRVGLEMVGRADWPQKIGECDFLAFTCALTHSNRHMLNRNTLSLAKKGVRIVNVARGPLIDELALEEGLKEGRVHSAALDVFEREPLPADSPLRHFDKCIYGSHNASNTADAVLRASDAAISALFGFLDIRTAPCKNLLR